MSCACIILRRHVQAAAVRCLLAVFAAGLLLGSAYPQEPGAPSQAGETAAKLQPLTAEERVDLIAKLDDTQARELLLHYLEQADPIHPASKGPEDLFSDLEQKAVVLRTNAAAAARSVVDLPAALATAGAKLAAGEGIAGYLVVLAALAVLIGAGTVGEWLFAYAVRRFRDDLRSASREGHEAWLRTTFALMLLNLLGILVFTGGYVLAFLALWQGNEARRELAAAVLVGILVVRLTRCFAEFVLGPESSGERIISLTQVGAQYFYKGAVRIAIVGVVVVVAAYLIGLWYESVHLATLLMAVAGAIFVGYAATVIWRGRQHAAAALVSTGEGSGSTSWPLRGLAYAWAPVVIVYMVVVYVSALAAALAGTPVGTGRAIAALLLIVVAVPVLDRFVGIIIARYSPTQLDPAVSTGHKGVVLRRVARIIIFVGALVAVLSVFGLTSAASGTLGSWLIRLVFNIGVVVLIAYILRELAIAAINRKLAAESASVVAGQPGLDIAQSSRLKTILPLMRRALQLAIVTVAALMILSSLGVNIGPLLAGAGVIGLAVGFGSQTLVKDLISGLFFLLDDAFRVGEYIEIGGFGGEVERINVRSLSLRTPLGAIHTIPFGGIDVVANYSRDWAIVKLEFRVTYDTDMTKVKKIFRQIGEDLAKDPELAPGFLQPFKFQGVKAMEETGILLRGKFMAVPGTQFQIRKAIFERVQKAFKEQGIKFAQRRVQVDLPPGLDVDEHAREVITNAAAAAVATEPTRA